MYRIGQVAVDLDIAPTTLRRLCDRFAPYLTDEAGDPTLSEDGRREARRFTDDDLVTLRLIKEQRAAGRSDEEIEAQLRPAAPNLSEEGQHAITLLESDDKIVLSQEEAAALGTALRQFAVTQQALLNSQQALRDLLGVVINDAMALKDNNERLRRRLRVLEEEVSRMKESDWNHRLSLEERINQVEQDQNKKKRSWWERL